MNLTSDIIFEQLSGVLTIKNSGLNNREPHLLRPEFFEGKISFLSNHLYIVPAESLPANPVLEPSCCIISVGRPPKAYYSDDISLLELEETVDIIHAFNLVQAIYNRFDEWELMLQRCVLEADSLQCLLDVSKHLFTNPIVVTNESFHVLASSGYHGFEVVDELGDVPDWVVNSLRLDPEWQKFKNSTGLYLYRYKFLDYDILCYVLRIQGEYAGGITLSETNGPNSPGTWTLFKILTNYIQLFYERYWIVESGQSFKSFCKQLLDGVQITRNSIENALERLAWSPTHSFTVYYIDLNTADYRYIMSGHVCRHLEHMFQHAVAFEHNSIVVMLINDTLIGNNAQNLRVTFSNYVTEGLLKVGISNVFSDIFQFQNYYLQSAAALEIGLRMRPMRWIHHFNDYCLDYMLEHCSGGLSRVSLLPSGLIAMNAYDLNHGTAYVKTLHMYFKNKFNPTHTARELYIHRSTLIDRLKRIENFLKLDLNDPDNQLYLFLCLKLM